MDAVLDFVFGTRTGGWLFGGVVFLGLIAFWQLDRMSQREIGSLRKTVEVEKNNAKVIKRAQRVRRKSRTRRVRNGLRDPFTVDH